MSRRTFHIATAAIVTAALIAASSGASTAAVGAPCPSPWTVVPSPSPGNVNNSLLDVDAASPTDVWAVGSQLREVGPALVTLPVTLRWNGSAWAGVPLQPGLEAQLAGVKAFGPKNVWAVGWVIQGTTESIPLIEHFDGTEWHAVANPPTAQANLLAIDGAAPNDIWAVGLVRGFAPHLLAEHWDGTSWKRVPTPAIASAYVDLESVVALGPSSVWAVGYVLANNGDYAPLSLHWNGARWTGVPVPNLGEAGSQLYDVTTTSEGTVLAVGQTTDASFQAGPLALRWDGGAWRPLGGPIGSNSVLGGVSRAGAGALMAVGWRTDALGVQRTLTESFANGSWTVVPSPDAGGGSRLSDVTSVPRSRTLVAVGTANPFGVGRNLVEAMCFGRAPQA